MGPENRIPINTLTYIDAKTGERKVLGPPLSRRESFKEAVLNNKPFTVYVVSTLAIVVALSALAVESCQREFGSIDQLHSIPR